MHFTVNLDSRNRRRHFTIYQKYSEISVGNFRSEGACHIYPQETAISFADYENQKPGTTTKYAKHENGKRIM